MTLAVRGRALRALLALPLLSVSAVVEASGFAIESQGSRAMGFAGAYVAQAADPSAIFYNAAGIGFLKGKQLYVGGALAGLSTDFTGSGPNPPTGTLEQSNNNLALLPTIYYSQQVGEKMVVGLGVSRPFGTRSEWQNPDDFTGRYICLECQIDSWSINPTIAFRLADRFSIGAGVDVRLSSFKLSRRLVADPNPFPVPTDVAELTLDVHLMIEKPELYIEAFRRAGADRITIHVEACRHLHRVIHQIREAGAAVGVALNPATSLTTLTEILTELDLILIMTVNPGFGGQTFISNSLGKIRTAREMLGVSSRHVRLEVDGGIDLDTAPQVVRAGADVLVAGSSIFGAPDVAAACAALRKQANEHMLSV